jgi:hypothetical protein
MSPYKDPEVRRAYWRKRHHDNPELDRERQRHRVRANAIFRERYREEYDKLVRIASYEGVKGNDRYVSALRTLRQRHPEAWVKASEDAR